MNKLTKVFPLVDLVQFRSIVPIGLQMTGSGTMSVLLDVLIEWT